MQTLCLRGGVVPLPVRHRSARVGLDRPCHLRTTCLPLQPQGRNGTARNVKVSASSDSLVSHRITLNSSASAWYLPASLTVARLSPDLTLTMAACRARTLRFACIASQCEPTDVLCAQDDSLLAPKQPGQQHFSGLPALWRNATKVSDLGQVSASARPITCKNSERPQPFAQLGDCGVSSCMHAWNLTQCTCGLYRC